MKILKFLLFLRHPQRSKHTPLCVPARVRRIFRLHCHGLFKMHIYIVSKLSLRIEDSVIFNIHDEGLFGRFRNYC